MKPGVGSADGQQPAAFRSRIPELMAERARIKSSIARREDFEGALIDGHFQGAVQHVDELLPGMTMFVGMASAGFKYEQYWLNPTLHVPDQQVGTDAFRKTTQFGAFTLPDNLNQATTLLVGQQVRHAQLEHAGEFLQPRGGDVRLSVFQHGEEASRHAGEARNISESVFSRKPHSPEPLAEVFGTHGFEAPEIKLNIESIILNWSK